MTCRAAETSGQRTIHKHKHKNEKPGRCSDFAQITILTKTRNGIINR